jgi:phosphotransferase system enzyme I (PtsI)
MEESVRFEKKVVVSNRVGLHVRAASLFVDTAQKFASNIRVRTDQREADGKSILDMLTLGAAPGVSLLLIAEGKDAQQAINSLEELVKARFHEE